MRTLTPVEALSRLLGEYAARDGRRPDGTPHVVELGTEDLLAWERSPLSDSGEPRPDLRDARIFLTSRAVLVGPWGSGRGCGHCLALRLQRMQPSHERDLLEIGIGTQRAGVWPTSATSSPLPCGPVSGTPNRPPTPLRPLRPLTPLAPRGFWRVDIRTLMVTAAELLRDSRCPSCGDLDPAPPDVDLGAPRKSSPDTYRLRRPEDYAVPVEALVNPVCGVLAPFTFSGLNSPTTAPVTGSVRGPIGLHDLSWSSRPTPTRPAPAWPCSKAWNATRAPCADAPGWSWAATPTSPTAR